MSADFWAGYISGAIGIIIGNPLDIIKVRLQAHSSPSKLNSGIEHGIPPSSPSSPHTSPSTNPLITSTTSSTNRPSRSSSLSSILRSLSAFSAGTAAPILGYGALNALLFVSYNRSAALLNSHYYPNQEDHPISQPAYQPLWTTWIAGAIGGLATWVVSTPTELIKCRAQLSGPSSGAASSWTIAKQVFRGSNGDGSGGGGIRGFYQGGTVTMLRDSIGYGFYFWTYELATRSYRSLVMDAEHPTKSADTAGTLLCGGVAGVLCWALIFPLDMVKTRLQTQAWLAETATAASAASTETPSLGSGMVSETRPLLANIDPAHTSDRTIGAEEKPRRLGAMAIAKQAYQQEGLGVFFRGLGVCSVRAFIVNAVQWATYEFIMAELTHK